jgi:hypothetical protein
VQWTELFRQQQIKYLEIDMRMKVGCRLVAIVVAVWLSVAGRMAAAEIAIGTLAVSSSVTTPASSGLQFNGSIGGTFNYTVASTHTWQITAARGSTRHDFNIGKVLTATGVGSSTDLSAKSATTDDDGNTIQFSSTMTLPISLTFPNGISSAYNVFGTTTGDSCTPKVNYSPSVNGIAQAISSVVWFKIYGE